MRNGLNNTLDKNCQIKNASANDAIVSKPRETPEASDERERNRSSAGAALLVAVVAVS